MWCSCGLFINGTQGVPSPTDHPSIHYPFMQQVVFLPNGKVLTVHKPGELHVYDSILAKSQVRDSGVVLLSCRYLVVCVFVCM